MGNRQNCQLHWVGNRQNCQLYCVGNRQKCQLHYVQTFTMYYILLQYQTDSLQRIYINFFVNVLYIFTKQAVSVDSVIVSSNIRTDKFTCRNFSPAARYLTENYLFSNQFKVLITCDFYNSTVVCSRRVYRDIPWFWGATICTKCK